MTTSRRDFLKTAGVAAGALMQALTRNPLADPYVLGTASGAALAAFGLARSGQVLLRAVIGMALGFAYFVGDNFSLAMGNAGTYPNSERSIAIWKQFVQNVWSANQTRVIAQPVIWPKTLNVGYGTNQFARNAVDSSHMLENGCNGIQ